MVAAIRVRASAVVIFVDENRHAIIGIVVDSAALGLLLVCKKKRKGEKVRNYGVG